MQAGHTDYVQLRAVKIRANENRGRHMAQTLGPTKIRHLGSNLGHPLPLSLPSISASALMQVHSKHSFLIIIVPAGCRIRKAVCPGKWTNRYGSRHV